MRLDIALMNRFGGEFTFDYMITGIEGGINIAVFHEQTTCIWQGFLGREQEGTRRVVFM